MYQGGLSPKVNLRARHGTKAMTVLSRELWDGVGHLGFQMSWSPSGAQIIMDLFFGLKNCVKSIDVDISGSKHVQDQHSHSFFAFSRQRRGGSGSQLW